MLGVSAAFKTAAVATTRKVAQRVRIWFADNSSKAGSITATANEFDSTLFPKTKLVNGKVQAQKRWALARTDCYPADDLYPIDTGYEGGWFDDTLSDGSGNLAVAAEVVIAFSAPQTVTTLEWFGDSWLGYLVDFKWYWWNSGTSAYVLHTTVTGNTQTYHAVDVSAAPLTSTKFKLEINKISRAGSYPNLVEVQAGMMADVSADVKSIEITKERYYRQQGTIPIGNAAAAELSLVLVNHGAYDPRNASGTYYGNILPNRRVAVELGFVLADGTTEYCDAGVYYVNSWNTNFQGDMSVRALDGVKKLIKKSYQGAVQEGKTISQLVEVVLQAAGMAADDYQIDATTQIVPYAVFEEKKVWDHLRRLAEAEGGFIYFDESGVLRFESRTHLAGHALEAFTVDADKVLNTVDSIDEERIRNVVRAKSNRLKESAEAELWSLQETLTVPGSGTLTVEVYFQDPAVDIQAPVITAGGAHVTVDSYTYTSKGGTVVLANSDPLDETVIGMTIDGKALVADGQIVAEAQGADLVLAYGEVVQEINNDFIQSREQAQDLVDDLLASYSDPGNEVEVDMPVRGQPHLQLGDKVAVSTTRPYISANFYVVRSTLRYDGGLSGSLRLLKA